jgi:hypothetical protein
MLAARTIARLLAVGIHDSGEHRALVGAARSACAVPRESAPHRRAPRRSAPSRARRKHGKRGRFCRFCLRPRRRRDRWRGRGARVVRNNRRTIRCGTRLPGLDAAARPVQTRCGRSPSKTDGSRVPVRCAASMFAEFICFATSITPSRRLLYLPHATPLEWSQSDGN